MTPVNRAGIPEGSRWKLAGALSPAGLVGLDVIVVGDGGDHLPADALVTVKFVYPDVAMTATDGVFGRRAVRVPAKCLGRYPDELTRRR